MSFVNPVLNTQSELIDRICRKVGPGFSQEQAKQALTDALRLLSQSICSCFCKVLPEMAEHGKCEYDCGCCGVDVVKPYIRPFRCGCGEGQCWHEIKNYDFICGKLQLDGTLRGEIKVEYFVPPPPIQDEAHELSAVFDDGDGTLWIKGRIDNLPPAGYIKVHDHWLSYQCFAQVAIREDNLFETILSEAWLNPDEEIATDVEIKSGAIYDGTPELVSGPECGIHTVLHQVQPACPSIHREEFYSIGTPVEFGVAAENSSMLTHLMDAALVSAYEARVTSCATDIERDTAFTMIAYYSEKVEKARRSMPRRRVRAYVCKSPLSRNGTRKRVLSRHSLGRNAFGPRSKVYH